MLITMPNNFFYRVLITDNLDYVCKVRDFSEDELDQASKFALDLFYASTSALAVYVQRVSDEVNIIACTR